MPSEKFLIEKACFLEDLNRAFLHCTKKGGCTSGRMRSILVLENHFLFSKKSTLSANKAFEHLPSQT